MKVIKFHVDGFIEYECECEEKLLSNTDIFLEHKSKCPHCRT